MLYGSAAARSHGPCCVKTVYTVYHFTAVACSDCFVQRGADVQAVDGSGRTALMGAAWAGSLPCVTALLAAGAQVDAAEHDTGVSALIMAAMQGHTSVVEPLLVSCRSGFAVVGVMIAGVCHALRVWSGNAFPSWAAQVRYPIMMGCP